MSDPVVSCSLPPIEVLDEVGSTNALMMERGRAGAAHGAAVRARVQTAGRGRRAHGWCSPEGGLYLSVLIRPQVVSAQLPGLPVACALGVVDALRAVGCSRARLKWPNDVVVGRAKLAGILTELGQTAGGPFAVCGVGVNVDESEQVVLAPDGLAPANLTDAFDAGYAPPNLDELAERVRTGILDAERAWEREVQAAGNVAIPLVGLVDAYNEHLAFRDERVSVFAVDGAQIGSGILRGVDEWGHALVEDGDGCIQALDSSLVSIRPVG